MGGSHQHPIHHHPNTKHRETAGGQDYPQLNFGPGAKWVKSLTQGRVGNFTGGHYSDVNLSSFLFTHRIDDPSHVKLQVWSAPGLSKPSFEEAMKQKFREAKKGEQFGPSWTNHWWKVSLTIPPEWSQYEHVQFEFDPGCEAMIFTTDGLPLQGITGDYGGDRRVEHIVPDAARKAGRYDFVIESSCNGMFGVSGIGPPDMNRYFTLASADLVVPNQEAWRLMWDFNTLRELINTLPGNTPLQNKALTVANHIMNVFDHTDPSSIAKCRKIAEEVFGEGWESKGADIYKEGPKVSGVWGIGHCHIDTAWLWPYSCTQQKVARSWSTQIDLMERFPEHRFACSSAQQYKWLEQLYPSLFERLKEKVKEGKFHPIGGAWVEHDGNMPSGEALVRQNLYAQAFFKSRFGIRSKTGWLPDSFGLSGAIPQILRGAGMDYFFTQKLSWNNINVFPHSTFSWVGIDGTQVLCHMTPVDTYTAQATTDDVRKAIWNNKNLESSDKGLLVFGNGDGGGGPLATMLENLRRIRAVANEHREIPVVSMGSSVDDFFEEVRTSTNGGETLPNWHGELYLEFHRGTYTSHGSIKKGNRKSEVLLRDVEYVATLASLYRLKNSGYVYPKERIDDSWEKVLLNQFHDVLPGSAIGMVYEDAEKLYAEVARDGKELLEEAFGALLQGSVPLSLSEPLKSKNKGRIVGFNPVHAPRREVVNIPLGGIGGSKLKSEAVQISKDGSSAYVLMDCPTGAGLAFAQGMFADAHPATARAEANGDFSLFNSSISMTISKGRIVSLYDVILERELIPAGKTGGLVIFEDRPGYWDAWDVEIYHLEKYKTLEFSNVRVNETGPARASLLADVKYGQSTIAITISLDATTASMAPNSRSFVRFDAQVDWHQRHEFLKFEIPLDIHNPNAIFETQFGTVSRPTHKNTSWDAAKFEVCAHKFADLSEYGYGVAILSESKYGFSADGIFLRISLLRAATSPDAEQDQGQHEFSWGVMPHAGHFLESDVPVAAHFFNSPLHLRYAPEDLAEIHHSSFIHKPPFRVEGAKNVILETIKRGEEDSYGAKARSGPVTVVLRLYEAYGGHAKAKLRISNHLKVTKASLTNLLEDDEQNLNVYSDKNQADTLIDLAFRGFQVVTVKLTVEYDAAPTSTARRESWVRV